MNQAWTEDELKAAVLAFNRAIGMELRRERERAGIYLDDLSKKLPSAMGSRSLLAYETGTRQMTLFRFVEYCEAVGADASKVLRRGLQRGRIAAKARALDVDLHALLEERKSIPKEFQPLRQWALNAIRQNKDHVITIERDGLRSLALIMGGDPLKLAAYLGKFTPKSEVRTKMRTLPILRPRSSDHQRGEKAF